MSKPSVQQAIKHGSLLANEMTERRETLLRDLAEVDKALADIRLKLSGKISKSEKDDLLHKRSRLVGSRERITIELGLIKMRSGQALLEKFFRVAHKDLPPATFKALYKKAIGDDVSQLEIALEKETP